MRQRPSWTPHIPPNRNHLSRHTADPSISSAASLRRVVLPTHPTFVQEFSGFLRPPVHRQAPGNRLGTSSGTPDGERCAPPQPASAGLAGHGADRRLAVGLLRRRAQPDHAGGEDKPDQTEDEQDFHGLANVIGTVAVGLETRDMKMPHSAGIREREQCSLESMHLASDSMFVADVTQPGRTFARGTTEGREPYRLHTRGHLVAP